MSKTTSETVDPKDVAQSLEARMAALKVEAAAVELPVFLDILTLADDAELQRVAAGLKASADAAVNVGVKQAIQNVLVCLSNLKATTNLAKREAEALLADTSATAAGK